MSKLERIVHDDSNGLDYILVGEIYLPLIAVSEEKRDIGFFWKPSQKLSERLQRWLIFLSDIDRKALDLPCRLK